MRIHHRLMLGVAMLACVQGVACSRDASQSVANGVGRSVEVAVPARQGQTWQEDFGIEQRTLSDTGRSRYFILEPGYQLVLGGGNTKVTETVLDETRDFNGIRTRVVESREEENGQPVEITKNFFAIDNETGDVFYFGEEVFMYQRGGVVVQSGSWLAYTDGARPGLFVPGTPTVGMRYYIELAPGAAMDRAEVTSVSETIKTPAGEFQDCLVTMESSALESAIEHKAHAPDIGIIQDQSLNLLSHGFIGR